MCGLQKPRGLTGLMCLLHGHSIRAVGLYVLGSSVPKYTSMGCRVTRPHGYFTGILGCREILAKWTKPPDATRMRGSGGERGLTVGTSLKGQSCPDTLVQGDPGLFYSWVSGGLTAFSACPREHQQITPTETETSSLCCALQQAK